jgi:pimeloyl-ACP methyl ester carboxylesterase
MLSNVQKWFDSGSYFHCNEIKIFYLQKGIGPDLLIIHGYPYSSYEWSDCTEVLSRNFRVTLIDLLGMGFSDKPPEHNYSYEEHTEIINSLMTFLGVQSTHILSHDLGVSVTQELIARAAENKNNFSIISAAFANGSLFTEVYRPRIIQRLLSQTPKFIGKRISKAITEAMVNKSVRSLYGKNSQPSDTLMRELWDVLIFNNGKDLSYLIGRLIFEKARYQSRWISAMQHTSIPMCYICGPSDPNSGMHMADKYIELLPHSTLLLMREDIGHWPMIEDRQSFLNSYMKWVKVF